MTSQKIELKTMRRELIKAGIDTTTMGTEEVTDSYNAMMLRRVVAGAPATPIGQPDIDAAQAVDRDAARDFVNSIPKGEKMPSEPAPQDQSTMAAIVDKISIAMMKAGTQGVTHELDQFLAQRDKASDQVWQKHLDDKVSEALADAPDAITSPRVITRTITLDSDGKQVTPAIPDATAQPHKRADEIWPELLKEGGAPYLFPMADFDHATAKYHNVTSLHKDGLLKVIADAQMTTKNIWLKGESGTGKSTLIEHIGAMTNRPFFRIAHHAGNEVADLVGCNIIKSGSVEWQDGAFTRAIRTPFAVILLDEPTLNYKACQLYQTVLDERYLTIETTGEVVHVAEGVTFVVADNTGGHGDDSGRYDGTMPVNQAFLERFSCIIPIDYMKETDEVEALKRATAINKKSALKLVVFANLARRAAEIEQPITFRRLMAFAELLRDGTPQKLAFELSILSHVRNDSDREAIQTLAMAHLDQKLTTRRGV